MKILDEILDVNIDKKIINDNVWWKFSENAHAMQCHIVLFIAASKDIWALVFIYRAEINSTLQELITGFKFKMKQKKIKTILDIHLVSVYKDEQIHPLSILI